MGAPCLALSTAPPVGCWPLTDRLGIELDALRLTRGRIRKEGKAARVLRAVVALEQTVKQVSIDER